MFLVVRGGHMRMANGGSGKPDSRPVSRNFSWISCWFDDGRGASPAIKVWPEGANTAIFSQLTEQFYVLYTMKKGEVKHSLNKISANLILPWYQFCHLDGMAYDVHKNVYIFLINQLESINMTEAAIKNVLTSCLSLIQQPSKIVTLV